MLPRNQGKSDIDERAVSRVWIVVASRQHDCIPLGASSCYRSFRGRGVNGLTSVPKWVEADHPPGPQTMYAPSSPVRSSGDYHPYPPDSPYDAEKIFLPHSATPLPLIPLRRYLNSNHGVQWNPSCVLNTE